MQLHRVLLLWPHPAETQKALPKAQCIPCEVAQCLGHTWSQSGGKMATEQRELTLGLSVVSDPRRLPQDSHSTTRMCIGFLGWEEEEHVSTILFSK